MIQINLIPDVKQEYIRAQRMRNAAISISILSGIGAVGIVALLGLALGAQTIHETLSRAEIDKQFKLLKNTDNIDNILTLQNQLTKIQSINDSKTRDSRLFDVLTAINPSEPNNIKVSNVKLDPAVSKVTIEGSAVNGYSATETFRKTILNTKIVSGSGDSATTTALTDDVVIGETSYGQASDGGRVLRFTISFKYPKGLFDNSITSLQIASPSGKIDVTDSRTRVPESLFNQKATDLKEGN